MWPTITVAFSLIYRTTMIGPLGWPHSISERRRSWERNAWQPKECLWWGGGERGNSRRLRAGKPMQNKYKRKHKKVEIFLWLSLQKLFILLYFVCHLPYYLKTWCWLYLVKSRLLLKFYLFLNGFSFIVVKVMQYNPQFIKSITSKRIDVWHLACDLFQHLSNTEVGRYVCWQVCVGRVELKTKLNNLYTFFSKIIMLTQAYKRKLYAKWG